MIFQLRMSIDPALSAYMGVFFALLLPLCAIIVYVYAEPGFPWHSYITLTIGYYAAFAILIMVPIDIAIVIQDRKSDAVGKMSLQSNILNSNQFAVTIHR